ncbi:hypothetical protein QGP82_23590 [Leptothoe sp. LEGE 181152]|uniref:Uncharacterized protein n=1 Tax=Adonisia turfae CCMR0081 TaxID=2292702 RepID=A0A6M0RV71_9CYAN|nr:hypothetical protein [Adonisia turfae]MDV3351706.1 hypothetical protein [Leptothoe sp. LEGE 181152]NEZ60155.1 hypothetical protein [Adonisia turfae CCMR0081]
MKNKKSALDRVRHLLGYVPEDDEAIMEISNDEGDHWVMHVPTHDLLQTGSSLIGAGAEVDKDEELYYQPKKAQQEYDSRDHQQYRFKAARIVDEDEDDESTFDYEDDRTRDHDYWDYEVTDYNSSKVPKKYRWWQ